MQDCDRGVRGDGSGTRRVHYPALQFASPPPSGTPRFAGIFERICCWQMIAPILWSRGHPWRQSLHPNSDSRLKQNRLPLPLGPLVASWLQLPKFTPPRGVSNHGSVVSPHPPRMMDQRKPLGFIRSAGATWPRGCASSA